MRKGFQASSNRVSLWWESALWPKLTHSHPPGPGSGEVHSHAQRLLSLSPCLGMHLYHVMPPPSLSVSWFVNQRTRACIQTSTYYRTHPSIANKFHIKKFTRLLFTLGERCRIKYSMIYKRNINVEDINISGLQVYVHDIINKLCTL